MTAPVVVKLGGSLVTDREEYRTLDKVRLARLAGELANATRPLVVVHGAGSFGHVLAERHRLHEGSLPRTRARLEAFARVHEDVRELNRLVNGALREAGFCPVTVSPLDVAHMTEGVVDRLDLAPFERSLVLGLTPVTFGDAIHDSVRGWGILSGDALATRLAVGLGAETLLHATDVDGVFGRHPPEAGDVPIAALDVAGARAAAAAAGARSGRPDVTGGMASKLRAAADAAEGGVDVVILNGGVAGRLADAVAEKPVPGTVVRGRGRS